MSQRTCSFCKAPGHKINKCIHPAAIDLKHSAEFKCSIAIQYFCTGEEKRMTNTIENWFTSLSILELRVLISLKGFSPVGIKSHLIARAVYIYFYTLQPSAQILNDQTKMNRFVSFKHYYDNIAKGMEEATALLVLTHELRELSILVVDGLQIQSSECPICFDTKDDLAKTNCGHIFCHDCITKHTKGVSVPCPCCRTDIDLLIVK